jgi:hypothetical protein
MHNCRAFGSKPCRKASCTSSFELASRGELAILDKGKDSTQRRKGKMRTFGSLKGAKGYVQKSVGWQGRWLFYDI